MTEKPKRTSSAPRVVIMAIAISLVLCVGFFVAIFGLVTSLLEPAATVASGFMEAVRDEDYQGAFDLFSSELKTEVGSAEALQGMILDGDAQPAEWSFTSQSVENNIGQFTGQVTLASGGRVPLQIMLEQNDSGWRIIAFEWGE